MAYVKWNIADNAYGILAQDVEIDDTTITLTEQNNLPEDNTILTLVQKDSAWEIIKSEKVKLSSRNDLTLTVQRWFDGDVAKEFKTWDYIYLYVVSSIVKDVQDEVSRLGSVKANDSEVVHKSGNETITGTKTMIGDTSLQFKEGAANAYTWFKFLNNDGTIIWEIKKNSSDMIYISHWNKTVYMLKDWWVWIGSVPGNTLGGTNNSLAIGDSDTWFLWNSDWNLSWYANNQEVFNWTSSLFKFYKNIQYNNEATLNLWYGLNWQLLWSGANSYKFKNHNWDLRFEIKDNWELLFTDNTKVIPNYWPQFMLAWNDWNWQYRFRTQDNRELFSLSADRYARFQSHINLEDWYDFNIINWFFINKTWIHEIADNRKIYFSGDKWLSEDSSDWEILEIRQHTAAWKAGLKITDQNGTTRILLDIKNNNIRIYDGWWAELWSAL